MSYENSIIFLAAKLDNALLQQIKNSIHFDRELEQDDYVINMCVHCIKNLNIFNSQQKIALKNIINNINIKYMCCNESFEYCKPDYVLQKNIQVIPIEYRCVYYKLLLALTDFGDAIMHPIPPICKCVCKNETTNSCKNQLQQPYIIITCWNLFQSAIACYYLGRVDQANRFIKSIYDTLKRLYKHYDKRFDLAIYEINDKGQLILLCGNDSLCEIVVDENNLYQMQCECSKCNKCIIKNNNLNIIENVCKM